MDWLEGHQHKTHGWGQIACDDQRRGYAVAADAGVLGCDTGSARRDRRSVAAGVSPYRAAGAAANRPGLVYPQCLAIEATVSAEGSDSSSS